MPGLVNGVFALTPTRGAQIAVRHTLQKNRHPVARPEFNRAGDRHAALPNRAARLADHHSRSGRTLLSAGDTQFVMGPDELMLAVPTLPGAGDLAGEDEFRTVGKLFECQAGHAGCACIRCE